MWSLVKFREQWRHRRAVKRMKSRLDAFGCRCVRSFTVSEAAPDTAPAPPRRGGCSCEMYAVIFPVGEPRTYCFVCGRSQTAGKDNLFRLLDEFERPGRVPGPVARS